MIKLHDMLLAGQAGVFTHDGEDFLMSCQKGSTVFFPVQTRLHATKIGWRGAIILLQLLLLYGTCYFFLMYFLCFHTISLFNI